MENTQDIAAISTHEATRFRMLCASLVIAICVTGIGCRLAQFFSRQAFWEDEVAVLVNLQHHPARELPFVKLEAYAQESPVAAPPLFLWATQWMGNHFHYHEYACRLLPLLCSIATVILFAHLAWRLIGPAAAVWAVALVAFSDPLIFQAATVKPYSGDVLIAVLIAWIGLSPKPSMPARRLLLASVITAVGIWLSYAAVFTFAAVAIALWPQLSNDRRKGFAQLIALSIPAVASFLVVYFLCIRAQRQVNLDVYWIHMFPDYSHPLSLFRWFFGGTWEMFRYQMYPIGPIMLAATGLGIWKIKKNAGHTLLLVLLLPWGFNFVASCLAQYPYGGTRLTLFLLPFFALLAGTGAAAIPSLLPAPGRISQAILAAVPITMIGLAAYQTVVPRNKGNLRDAVQYLNAHRKPGEAVYLVGNQTLGASPWYLPEGDPLVYRHLKQEAPIRGSRFWIVICYEPRKFKENKIALTQPDARVDESRSLHINGADVCWFEPARE